jgi:hypothetical protein
MGGAALVPAIAMVVGGGAAAPIPAVAAVAPAIIVVIEVDAEIPPVPPVPSGPAPAPATMLDTDIVPPFPLDVFSAVPAPPPARFRAMTSFPLGNAAALPPLELAALVIPVEPVMAASSAPPSDTIRRQ